MEEYMEEYMVKNPKWGAALAVGVCVFGLAGGARGDHLSDLVPELFDRTIVLSNPEHAAHFLDESSRLLSLGNSVNEAVASQLSTFPLASPGGGLTYEYNPDVGVFERTSDFLGSLYGQRARTVGKNIWNVGVTSFQVDYDSLDGIDLSSGEMEFQLTHLDVAGPGQDLFFEGDLINAQIQLEVSSLTSLVFATYGVSDKFDLSVAVPFLDIDIEATGVLTIDRLGTQDIPEIHNFLAEGGAVDLDGDGLLDRLVFSNGDSASGVGDVLLRGKYRFKDAPGGGLAAALDLRLPTGDDKDLLGTGGTQVKLALLGSREFGPWSSHFQAAYSSLESGDVFEVPDELNLQLGFEYAASRRATIGVDILGRFQQDAVALDVNQETFTFNDGPFSPVQETVTRPVLSTGQSNKSLVLGVAGVRFNPWRNLLVSANVLSFFGDDGLTSDGIVPVLSIDFSG